MRTKKKRTAFPKQKPPLEHELTAEDQHENEKRFLLAICVVLFLFGLYQSVLFYGHKVVPNSDFPAFYRTGKSILSFQLPSTYKRAPVTGMLQCFLAPFMSGYYPELKAGWLVNAMLHPLNGILFFLLARDLIGRMGKWFALICLINPWLLLLMIDPIAETTLVFFILLTIFFIFRRSKWCYLFAAIGTMVRYECAALILAAFVIDMILSKDRKERLTAFGLAALASIPLALWMTATFIYESGSTHYFNVFKANPESAFSKLDEDRTGIIKHLGLIWSVGYNHLFSLPIGTSQDAAATVMRISRIVAACTFLLGTVLAVYRKSWKILVLGIFLVPYVLIHAYYPYPIPRFHVPSFWIALLISIYGITEGLKIIARQKYAAQILMVLGLVLMILCVFWFFSLVPNLEQCARFCPKAVSMPWVAVGAGVLMGGAVLYFKKGKGFFRELCIFSILLVIIVSNQLNAAWLINTGAQDAEFKELAEWYHENAQTGEKLATTMPGVVRLYLPPAMKQSLVNYRNIKGENLLDYAQKFEKHGVVYIAWDSRLGLAPQDPYYDLYHLEQIKPLVYPQNQGPYKFIKRIQNGNRFINIFKLEDVGRYRLPEPAPSTDD